MAITARALADAYSAVLGFEVVIFVPEEIYIRKISEWKCSFVFENFQLFRFLIYFIYSFNFYTFVNIFFNNLIFLEFNFFQIGTVSNFLNGNFRKIWYRTDHFYFSGKLRTLLCTALLCGRILV